VKSDSTYKIERVLLGIFTLALEHDTCKLDKSKITCRSFTM